MDERLIKDHEEDVIDRYDENTSGIVSDITPMSKRRFLPFIPEMYWYLYHKPVNLVLILLAIVPGVFSITQNIFWANVVDNINKPNAIEVVKKQCLYMLLYSVLNSFLVFFNRIIWFRLGYSVSSTIKSELYASLIGQEIEFYDKHTIGEFMTLMNEDAENVADTVIRSKSSQLRIIGELVTALMTLIVTSPLFALFPISLFLFIFFIKSSVRKHSKNLRTERSTALGKAMTTISECVLDVRVTHSFNRQTKSLHDIDFHLTNAMRFSAYSDLLGGTARSFGELYNKIILAAFYSLSCWLAANHKITVGLILSSSRALSQISHCISYLLETYQQEIKAIEHYECIKKYCISTIGYQTRTIPNFKGNIRFENVWFKYPTRNTWIYKGINFEIHPGKINAFVGYTGSGKSTLVQLILRYYDVDDGRILFDGVDIRELDSRWIHRVVGVVQQNPVLFNISIFDNIAYAKPETTTLEEVQNAARIAAADRFIMKIEKGYDTIVGERGYQLSGGQRQRVAIARAIIADPVVLITDEATSALSSKEEKKVQQALEEIMIDRTTIVIAHRLGTVKCAHIIHVVESGEIVQSGSHDELMIDTEGRYYNLMKLQLAE